MSTKFLRVVCMDLNGICPIIHTDANRKTMDEVNEFITVGMDKYPNGVWVVMPMEVSI